MAGYPSGIRLGDKFRQSLRAYSAVTHKLSFASRSLARRLIMEYLGMVDVKLKKTTAYVQTGRKQDGSLSESGQEK